jgi:hypothetical protein
MTQKYHAYLLRLWQTDDLEQPTWLASLEDPVTRLVTGFASLEALCDFIILQKNDPLPPEEPCASLGKSNEA